MLLSNALVALALASGIAGAPADLYKRAKVVLGYRTVVQAEADKINAAGAPVYEAQDYGGRQIGGGVYTTPNPAEWNSDVPDMWFCIIYCDSDALDRVSKAWVPQTWNNVRLWNREANIDNYIKDSLDGTWDPAKTIRMSYIFKYKDGTNLQLLIPAELVGPNGSMGLTAQCYPSASDLPETEVVNYDSWQNNIKGSRWPGSDPDPIPS